VAADEELLYVLSRRLHAGICEACWYIWSGCFDLVETFHLVCLKESWIIVVVVVHKGRRKGVILTSYSRVWPSNVYFEAF